MYKNDFASYQNACGDTKFRVSTGGFIPHSAIDLFKNKKIGQVNLHPACEGWILDILNP
jgi:hypothetical protein